MKEISPEEMLDLKESQINRVYNLETRAEGILATNSEHIFSLCGQGFQINDQIDRYSLSRYDIEQTKNKLLMRFSPGFALEEQLLFINGGGYKVYSK